MRSTTRHAAKIPAPPANKSHLLMCRVTEEEHKLVQRAAWEKNMLLSQYVRAVLMQKLGREQRV